MIFSGLSSGLEGSRYFCLNGTDLSELFHGFVLSSEVWVQNQTQGQAQPVHSEPWELIRFGCLAPAQEVHFVLDKFPACPMEQS